MTRWTLAPKEATEEMIRVGHDGIDHYDPVETWEAMLSASKPPVTVEELVDALETAQRRMLVYGPNATWDGWARDLDAILTKLREEKP